MDETTAKLKALDAEPAAAPIVAKPAAKARAPRKTKKADEA
jgi:hypothetical protein